MTKPTTLKLYDFVDESFIHGCYIPNYICDDLIIDMLYGIRRDLCFSLKKQGYCVRLYVPFGTEWLPYTLRRLREYKNLKFIISNIVKELWS